MKRNLVTRIRYTFGIKERDYIFSFYIVSTNSNLGLRPKEGIKSSLV